MAFCSNCGTKLIEGAVFCPECGTRNSVAGSSGTPEQHQAYVPSSPASHQTFQPTPTPPPPTVQNQYSPVKFEVEEKEFLKMVRVELQNSAFRYESGGMYYMRGNLEIEANLPSAGGFLKSIVTKEHIVKPVIRGTGTVFMEPTFGEFTILDLKGEEWILDKGAYYASEMGIEIGMFTNKAFSSLFSGEGFFQTRVAGVGKVVIISNGPLELVELNNEKFVVDGPIAVARTSGINLSIAKATKGLFSSMTSGEGIVNTFTGTGKVYIAPVANRYITLTNLLTTINHNVLSIRNKG
jgi:uncharacterized protein (AIM24 family)